MSYSNFRENLVLAMGARTQAQFAKDIGISAAHLSRLLNSRSLGSVNTGTLFKIASAAQNGVTYQMLADALKQDKVNVLSEEKLREAREDFGPSFFEAAWYTMAKVSDCLRDVRYPVVTQDLSDFVAGILENVTERDTLPVAFELMREFSYHGKSFNHSEFWCAVELTMAGSKETASSRLIIFFNHFVDKDGGDCYLIQLATTAVEAVANVLGLPFAAISAHFPETDDGEEPDSQSPEFSNAVHAAFEDPFYLHIKPVIPDVLPSGKSEEQRLLDAIFRNQDHCITTVEGFGFKLDAPPRNLLPFLIGGADILLSQYRKDDPDRARLAAILSDAQDTFDTQAVADALDEMEFNDTNGSHSPGWGAAVAVIITKETGFWFGHLAPSDDEDNEALRPFLSDKPCIIIEDEYISRMNIRQQTVLSVTAKYAKELGIHTFGELRFTHIEERLKPRTYTIKHTYLEKDGFQYPTDADEAKYSVNVAEGELPEKSGMYPCLLKDGRHMNLLFAHSTDGQNLWLGRHMEWTPWIESCTPEPMPIEEAKA